MITPPYLTTVFSLLKVTWVHFQHFIRPSSLRLSDRLDVSGTASVCFCKIWEKSVSVPLLWALIWRCAAVRCVCGGAATHGGRQRAGQQNDRLVSIFFCRVLWRTLVHPEKNESFFLHHLLLSWYMWKSWWINRLHDYLLLTVRVFLCFEPNIDLEINLKSFVDL